MPGVRKAPPGQTFPSMQEKILGSLFVILETRRGRAFAGMSRLKNPNRDKKHREPKLWANNLEDYVAQELEQQ